MKKCFWAVMTTVGLLLATTGQASAVSISVINDNGNDFSDFSSSVGEVDFDIGWNNNLPVWLQVTLTTADLASGDLFFSGFHDNDTGVNWTDFHVELEGGPLWSEVNDIDPTPSSVAGGAGNAATWIFANVSSGDTLTLGNPNTVTNPGEDWRIDASGLTGLTFDIHLHPSTVVPEPSTFALLGIGAVCLIGYRRKRKQNQDV